MQERLQLYNEVIAQKSADPSSSLAERPSPEISTSNEIKPLINEVYQEMLSDLDLHPFLLEGSGFTILDQMQVFVEAWKGVRSGMIAPEDAKTIFLQRTKEDLFGYYQEYLRRWPILVNPVAIGVVNGRQRMFHPRYGASLFVDNISADERDGAVREAAIIVEHEVLAADDGDIILFTSPSGWSGFTQPHPVSQTYVYQISNENGQKMVNALTIRHSLDLSQNEHFTSAITRTNPVRTTEEQRIKNVVTDVGRLRGEDLFSVIDRLEVASGYSEHALVDRDQDGNLLTTWSFDDLRQAIANQQELELVQDQVIEIVARFEQYVLHYLQFDRDLTKAELRQLMIELGRSVLDMTKAMGYAPGEISPQLVLDPKTHRKGNYANTHKANSALGGCNGGGGIKKSKFKDGEKVGTVCPRCGPVTARAICGVLVCNKCHQVI